MYMFKHQKMNIFFMNHGHACMWIKLNNGMYHKYSFIILSYKTPLYLILDRTRWMFWKIREYHSISMNKYP